MEKNQLELLFSKIFRILIRDSIFFETVQDFFFIKIWIPTEWNNVHINTIQYNFEANDC